MNRLPPCLHCGGQLWLVEHESGAVEQCCLQCGRGAAPPRPSVRQAHDVFEEPKYERPRSIGLKHPIVVAEEAP